MQHGHFPEKLSLFGFIARHGQSRLRGSFGFIDRKKSNTIRLGEKKNTDAELCEKYLYSKETRFKINNHNWSLVVFSNGFKRL